MLKIKLKLIKDYDVESMTHTEMAIIDDINSDADSFIQANSIESFAKGKPYSSTSLQRLANKLKYSSAVEMKSKLTTVYIEELKKIFVSFSKDEKVVQQQQQQEDTFEDRKDEIDVLNIKNYVNYLRVKFHFINWNLIDELEKDIWNTKNLYIYQPDSIYAFESFNVFCSFLDTQVHRIESEYRFELTKTFGVKQDSLVLFTKPFSDLNEFEMQILKYFHDKQIKIYGFTGVEGLFPKYVNNVLIGNYKKQFNQYHKAIIFKLLYDQVINIVVHNLYIKLFNKKEQM